MHIAELRCNQPLDLRGRSATLQANQLCLYPCEAHLHRMLNACCS